MPTLPNAIFLPGLLEDADAFMSVIEGLGDRAACSAADLTRSDSIAGMARDVLAQAPEGPLSIVAHSMGGYVALELMRQAPGRVQRLALLNTNARPDSAESTANRRRLLEIAARDFPAAVAALLPRQLTEAHLQDLGMVGTIQEMALGLGLEVFRRQQEAIIHRVDSRPHLGSVRCPTLVVAARDDQIMPLEILQELADGIPGAQLTVIEDCGHMATIEQPARVLQALVPWLERTTT